MITIDGYDKEGKLLAWAYHPDNDDIWWVFGNPLPGAFWLQDLGSAETDTDAKQILSELGATSIDVH